MKIVGIPCCRRISSRSRSGPLIPGMDTSRIRHRVSLMRPNARNSSAEANVSTEKPNSRSRSGSDPRTDSSSSTTETSGAACHPVFLIRSCASLFGHVKLAPAVPSCRRTEHPNMRRRASRVPLPNNAPLPGKRSMTLWCWFTSEPGPAQPSVSWSPAMAETRSLIPRYRLYDGTIACACCHLVWSHSAFWQCTHRQRASEKK